MDNSPKKARTTDNRPRTDFAKRLYDLRVDTMHNNKDKMTQDDTAMRLSQLVYNNKKTVTNKQISEWELGTKEPCIKDIEGLARVFNTTCDYLLTGVEPGRVDASRRYGLSNDALKKLEEMNSRMRLADYDEPHTFFYLKPVEFINMVITSTYLEVIAITAMEYALMKSRYNQMAESTDPGATDNAEYSDEHYEDLGKIGAIMKNNPSFANYKFVKKRDYLSSIEYSVSTMWNGIYYKFIGNESIFKNGIVQSDTLNREWLGLKAKE